MAIAIFFVTHWVAAVFFQTFFHHRYVAHRMFTMPKGWERVFQVCTYLAQGSSYLDPRGYAILHREHHAFSDSARDPHSPHNHPNVFQMMWETRKRYHDYAHYQVEPEARFLGGIPERNFIDRIGQTWTGRFAWMGAYTLFYVAFATVWWQYLFLPVHFVMGPVHGAIVNWCGHRYGYRNHATKDLSRNTLVIDAVTLGELFQNNHHRHPQRLNFANRWYEVDPAYWVIRLFGWLHIIDLNPRAHHDAAPAATDQAA
jgi:stearoyl-CoA desaturase (delta-9 desaturase)